MILFAENEREILEEILKVYTCGDTTTDTIVQQDASCIVLQFLFV